MHCTIPFNPLLNLPIDVYSEIFNKRPDHIPIWRSIDSEGNFNYNKYLILNFTMSLKVTESEDPTMPTVEYDEHIFSQLNETLKDKSSDAAVNELAKWLEHHDQYIHVILSLFPYLEITTEGP